MTKCTIILATFTLALFMSEKTAAIPIIITENFQNLSLLVRDAPNNKSVHNNQIVEVINSSFSFTTSLPQNTNIEPSAEEHLIQEVNNTVSSPNDRPPTISSVFTGFSKRDEQGFIDDSLDISFILNDYELSSKIQVFKEILSGYQFIPMELETWKQNIDNMVYSTPYSHSSRSSRQNTNDNNSKYQNDEVYFLQWRTFFDSAYFTWIKITFIAIFLILICKDLIRGRRSRK